MRSQMPPAAMVDSSPNGRAFSAEILDGLRQVPKRLPTKYLYDETGARLFDKICELPEYYLTRAELAIMQQYAAEIVRHIGPGTLLIEFGSGSSTKTRLLLDHLATPLHYVPVDISREHLEASAASLARLYPQVEIRPVCADFTGEFELPEPPAEHLRKVIYCPGSTIGNFEFDDAVLLLTRMARISGPGGGLLIGIDLKKDVHTIEAAYNDSQGVTAEFNLNLLRRINRELEADFRVDQFRHQAVYHVQRGRVELGLVSQCRQSATVAGEAFEFDNGEEIHTEYSHKYTVDEFSELVGRAGFALRQHWTDCQERFAVLYFVNTT